ncbi:MAG TPA: Mu transposase C-terminal domain-containing protein [Terracidiphilus sp.]|nr:Mu transposase C-terminal domain-containing protein [Terracidiphilus sp.]
MLSVQDFAAWAKRMGLTDEAVSVVAHVRCSQPARRVGGGHSNVTGRYPSRKMGVTIQFESHRVELPIVYELEHDDEVFEYYDQAPSIKLDYSSAGGKQLGVSHTPDFFVIRASRAGWEECKTEQELIRLSERNPNRYCRGDQGWICPPGREYAARFGLYYQVRSSAEINWLFQRNIQFLEDYLRTTPEVGSLSRKRVLAQVVSRPGCSLEDLFRITNGEVSRDEVYSLIAAGDIFVDLQSAMLPEPEKVRVWLEKSLCQDGGQAGSPVAHAQSDTDISASQIQRRLLLASEADLAEATRRFHIVSRALRGERHDPVPRRTLRRWIAGYRAEQIGHESGYLGLLPKPNHGNPVNKLPDQARSFMMEFIGKDYETLTQKTMYASWSALKLACDRRQIPAPSYRTFTLAVHHRAGPEQDQKRRGHRAAYSLQPFYWELEPRTPRHGDRPFEIAHIDHTEADVWAVCSQTGRILGRPWMSLLTDAFSRRILALYLTFDPPSYRSCMMVLRECVRRHSRLPQILVMDGGMEFQSIYFETLLARCEVTKKTRPPAKARFGSTCERIFGTTNERFLHNLRGNTQVGRGTRQVTKSVDPRNRATWPLKEIYRRLSEYAYEIYDTIDHPALGQSPREAFDAATAQTGSRSQRKITYDRDFLILTLPSTRKGTAKIAAGRGMKVNHLYYWSEHFRNPAWETRKVPVRYDPFDVGTAYAFVDGQWVECYSECYPVLHGRSEREVHMASEELRKRGENHSRKFVITARKLAEFLESVEVEEAILIQRLSDLEARSLQDQPGPSAKAVSKAGDHPRESLSARDAQPLVDTPASLTVYGEI